MTPKRSKNLAALSESRSASQSELDPDQLFDEGVEKLGAAVKACPTHSGRRKCDPMTLVHAMAVLVQMRRHEDEIEPGENEDDEPSPKPNDVKLGCTNPPKSGTGEKE